MDAQTWLETNGVPELLSAVVENLCTKRPQDVVQHIQRFLSTYNHVVVEPGPHELNGSDSGESDSEKKEEEIVIDDLKSDAIRRRYSTTTRRSAVSSEVTHFHTYDREWRSKEYHHSPEQASRIEKTLQQNILFQRLEKGDLAVVINHLFEKVASPGDVIIKQFDTADNFYIIESGLCNVYVKAPDSNEERQVTTLGPESCFGELALMYGTPRAATVTAATDVRLWCLDRDSYRHILYNYMHEKRRVYEEFLRKVPILETLTDYERATIADALQSAQYKGGSVIVKEGESGNSFYFIVSGEVQVTQKRNGVTTELAKLHAGDFFGEVALMLNQPRVATVTAIEDVSCVKLDRKSFRRLLGPIEEVLKRNINTYSLYIKEKL